jgi:hypothetical protein
VSQRSAKRSAAWLPNCCAKPLNLKLPGELSRYPRRLRGIDMFLKKAWRFLWRGSARATVAGPEPQCHDVFRRHVWKPKHYGDLPGHPRRLGVASAEDTGVLLRAGPRFASSMSIDDTLGICRF